MRDSVRIFSYRIGGIVVVCLFFVLCSREPLLNDFRSAGYQSMITRILLILLAGSAIGFMIGRQLSLLPIVRFHHLALITIFCGVVFYPLMSQFSFVSKSIGKVTDHLIRQQKQDSFSALTLFRQFPGVYEKYLNDYYRLPKGYVNLDALVKVYLFGVSPNSTVALGKNGFYYEGYGARKVEKGIVEKFDNIADYMGQFPFSETELEKWKRTLEERSYWLKEQGVDYVFVLAPTKAFVYPEYLPDALQKIKQGRTRYEQLSAYLREYADIYFIDLLPALLKAKSIRDYPLLFYKTDFHWNFYGSFIVYREIMRQVEQFFPQYNLSPLDLNDFDIQVDKHWAHHRFMDMVGLPVSLHRNEHYLTMVPKSGNILSSLEDIPNEGVHDVYPPEGKISNSKGESMTIRMVRNPQASVPSILLLGDSFFEKCVYYFAAHAKKVLNYRTIVNFPDKIFAYEKPTLVIQEILNMFILRAPPENPPGIRKAFLRKKFEDGGQASFILKQTDILTPLLFILPEMKSPEGKTLLAKAVLDADEAGEIKISALQGDNRETLLASEVVAKGSNTIFFQVPLHGYRKIIFAPKSKKSIRIETAAVEVRKINEF